MVGRHDLSWFVDFIGVGVNDTKAGTGCTKRTDLDQNYFSAYSIFVY